MAGPGSRANGGTQELGSEGVINVSRGSDYRQTGVFGVFKLIWTITETELRCGW